MTRSERSGEVEVMAAVPAEVMILVIGGFLCL